MRSLLLVAACAAMTAAAAAQESAYIRPSSYEARVGEVLDLAYSIVGPEALRASAWPVEHARWFFVRTEATQSNRDKPETVGEDGRIVRVELERPGVTVVGLDTRAPVWNTTAARVRLYTDRAGAADAGAALPEGDAPVRVRRIESAKVLVRVFGAAGQPGPTEAATSKTGQAVELRPLVDPTATPPGADVWVRAYVDGSPAAGARVLATCVATDKTQAVVADREGIACFRMTDAGPWRVEFHHVTASPDEAADWEVRTATLAFAAPEEGGGR